MVRGRRAFAWLALALALALGACGFRLQGAGMLPEDGRRVYVATADELTPFAMELRRAIERSGGEIVRSASAAQTVVRIQSDRSGRRVLSVSARNTPAEYEVYYEVDYSVDRAGVEAVPTQTLELQRNFSFDESLLLAKEREEEIIRDAMAHDLATLVLRKIGSL